MAIAGTAVMRAADAMLRALGGDEISLLLPSPGQSGGSNAELGLDDPGVQQITVWPVVVRALSVAETGPRRRIEFLLSASGVGNAVDGAGFSSADELFNSALAIQYRAELFHIESTVAERFAGTAYLYRIVAVE